jgi:hypothetical protein
MCYRPRPAPIEPATLRQKPVTPRTIERRIKAAQRCGLNVKAILPDGTLLTKNDDDKWVTIDGSALNENETSAELRKLL